MSPHRERNEVLRLVNNADRLGKLLTIIKARRLYEPDYPDFRHYVQGELERNDRWAYHYITVYKAFKKIRPEFKYDLSLTNRIILAPYITPQNAELLHKIAKVSDPPTLRAKLKACMA